MPLWATRLHAWVYRRSSGRFLGRMSGQPVLLLQTTGRRSGETQTTPVQYLADADTFVVVASNAGAARPPAWYLNLRADPHARVRVGARVVDVLAQEAAGRERAALWHRLTGANRYLQRAAHKAGRDLPLITLAPLDPDDSAAGHRATVTQAHATMRAAASASRPAVWFRLAGEVVRRDVDRLDDT